MRSKANLRLCVAACPQALAADCTRWASDLQSVLGRVTIAIRARDGGVLRDQKLSIDGVERRIGEPLELDPGRHELRAEAAGYEPRTQLIEVTSGMAGTSTMELDRAASKPREREAPNLVGPLVLGGVGLLILTGAAVLISAGHLDVSDMRDSCAPSCPADRVDGVRDLWTAGGVLAAAGGAAVIASGIWLGVSLTPETPIFGGASFRMTVEF